MSYSETLSKMIKESGLSLREISELCKEGGQKVDPSYISKLQTGNQDPASEDVNRALALACDQDPEVLLYEAFMHKAPKILKDFHNQLFDFFRYTASSIIDHIPLLGTKRSDYFKQQLMSLNDFDLIKFIQKEDLKALIPTSPKKKKLLSITETVSPGKKLYYDFLPQLDLVMIDDSMEPIIPKNAKLQIEKIESEISSGDIVGVLLSDKTHYIRRYVPIDNKVAFIAENRKYETMTLNVDEFEITGRIKSYTKII
jgi:transcriptional regulator with XRE-family HTH domain